MEINLVRKQNSASEKMTKDRIPVAGDDEFDLAGREIFRELGLDPDTAAPSELDSANLVYRAPGGGALYVGDQRVAK